MKYSQSLLMGIFLMSALVISSCDVLNIDPEQSLDDEMVFTDESAAQSAVIGMYDGLQEGGAFGGIGIMAADFPTDVSQFTGSFGTFQNIRDYDPLQATNGAVEDIWADTYEPINRANNVIHGVEEVPDITDEQVDQWKGEAKFVRALTYFHLVRYFGQPYIVDPGNLGVPLMLEPTEEPGEHLNIPRSTVGEVYDQIISDLNDARGWLGEDQEFDGQATVGAVDALLARVYLHQQDWDSAFDYANSVIEDSPYELSGDPMTPWADHNYNGPEFIFAVQNRTDDQIGVNDALASFHRPDSEGGRGDVRAFGRLLDAYEDDDLRLTELFYETDEDAEDGHFFTGKWVHPNQADNVPVLRMADVYLMRAEAAAELENETQALEDLNAIRARAGASEYDTDDYADEDELIDLILQERYLELAFEGYRRHDFLRRGDAIQDANQNREIAFGDNRTIFPIPAREIDVNPELEQNDGY